MNVFCMKGGYAEALRRHTWRNSGGQSGLSAEGNEVKWGKMRETKRIRRERINDRCLSATAAVAYQNLLVLVRPQSLALPHMHWSHRSDPKFFFLRLWHEKICCGFKPLMISGKVKIGVAVDLVQLVSFSLPLSRLRLSSFAKLGRRCRDWVMVTRQAHLPPLIYAICSAKMDSIVIMIFNVPSLSPRSRRGFVAWDHDLRRPSVTATKTGTTTTVIKTWLLP